MRVRIDEAACQGHTLCSFTAPAFFRLREDDGHAYLETELVPVELEDAVRRAVNGCPEQAIRIVSD